MQDGVFTDNGIKLALDGEAWKRLAGTLNGIALGIGLWVWFWPWPYRLAVLSAIIAFAVALAVKVFSHQRLRITDAKNGDSWPRIQLLFLMPALVVALRALEDINLLDWQPALLWTLGLTTVLAVPLFAGDSELPKKPLIAIFLLSLTCGYAWGSIAEVNAMFDMSTPHIFQTTIQSMRVYHGKSTRYHIVLGSWNGRPAGDDVTVPYAFYTRYRAGDPICVTLRDGWLGFRYYKANSCLL